MGGHVNATAPVWHGPRPEASNVTRVARHLPGWANSVRPIHAAGWRGLTLALPPWMVLLLCFLSSHSRLHVGHVSAHDVTWLLVVTNGLVCLADR